MKDESCGPRTGQHWWDGPSVLSSFFSPPLKVGVYINLEAELLELTNFFKFVFLALPKVVRVGAIFTEDQKVSFFKVHFNRFIGQCEKEIYSNMYYEAKNKATSFSAFNPS